MNAPTIDHPSPSVLPLGRTPEPAKTPAKPIGISSAHLLVTDQERFGFQSRSVGGDLLDSGQSHDEPHAPTAAVEPSAVDQCVTAPHLSAVNGTLPSQPIPRPVTQRSIGWLELRIWAEMHHDAQLQRIAATNRAERGGVDGGLYAPYLEVLERAENTARLGMVRSYRRIVPTSIRQWQKTQKGIGEHLLARLLGHLGDPAIATPHHWEGTGENRKLIPDLPFDRTVSQLWSYCGHGDPARRARKGMTAEDAAALGSPQIKMLVHLLAEACMKQGSGNEYRDIYEHRRIITAERTHAAPCVRCGPSGKPAAEGSTWPKAHQHADALRIVGKEILRDLWTVSRSAA